MSERLIAGNWKMNKTVSETVPLLERLKSGLPVGGVTSVVCPPFVSLHVAKQALADTGIGLGAQDMRPERNGALTGEVSAAMVAELCTHVILGHSERRQVLGETSELVNSKVISALSLGLRPIVCVGETLDEREADRAKEVVEAQLRASLSNVEDSSQVLVAYEPIWAIGTGLAACPQDAQEMAAIVRHELVGLYGSGNACEIPVLYGGSVNAENVSDFVDMSDIDGALVGGASLDPVGFIELTENAAPQL